MNDDSNTIHKKREEMSKRSRAEADAIFRLAGFEVRRVWELANGYWPLSPHYDDVRDPWWLYLTDIGPVQIGWRKRVIHIQWDACEVRGIVTTDETTKADTYVHAWKVETAITYLRALRALAVKPIEAP